MRSAAGIDVHIGTRLRECRVVLGISQRQLAELMGVTYRQMYKYERGHNRVPASALYELARLLHVPITFFYDGFDDRIAHEPASRLRALAEITRYFAAIQNERHQQGFSQLVRALAKG
jgi:transcriptional regulator with XRE-family HTH domain